MNREFEQVKRSLVKVSSWFGIMLGPIMLLTLSFKSDVGKNNYHFQYKSLTQSLLGQVTYSSYLMNKT